MHPGGVVRPVRDMIEVLEVFRLPLQLLLQSLQDVLSVVVGETVCQTGELLALYPATLFMDFLPFLLRVSSAAI